MRFASDIYGNLICASDPVDRYEECFCRACGEKLKHKKGNIYKPYFAHKPDTTCPYGKDADNKSEWHIRMQDYFINNKKVEHLFIDEQTGEKHIADVFDPESNTVIEFQKSHIDSKEFWKRTIFHASNGRRVVWVFDESKKDENGNYIPLGRFMKTEYSQEHWPYNELTYEWRRNPRRFLAKFPLTQEPIHLASNNNVLSICVFMGEDNDTIHRIVNQHNRFKDIVFSVHNILMKEDMNINEFFISEQDFQEIEPYKSMFKQYYSQQRTNYYQNYNSYNVTQVAKALNKMKRLNKNNRGRRF